MAVDHNNPQSRNEEILIAAIDGKEYNKPPQSRIEELLLELKEVIEAGGGGGTSDYTKLQNLPTINNITVTGDMTAADLSLVLAEVGKGLSTNDYSNEEKANVASLLTSIQSILDGSDIDSFGDVEIALLDKADISDLGTAAAKDSTNAVTSGSTDLVESGAVKDAIDAAVAAAYHHAGTKTVAQLTHDLLVAANEGNVYNITDSGTTTSDFIEGIGKTIDEGSNVGICKVGDVYMFDLLSGFVDTTNFVQKSQTSGLLKNDGTVNDEIEGDVDTLKDDVDAIDSKIDDSTTYPYADVITIEDAVPSNLADCNVKIEPVQDLHGYDKPWVGGAGKNKLPMTVDWIKAANASTSGTWSGNTCTKNGITFEILTDDTNNVIGIRVNGTSVRDTEFYVFTDQSNSCPFNGMLLNGCINGSDTTYDLRISDITTASTKQTTGDGKIINVTATGQWRCVIMIRSGYVASNLMFYPMIRLSTETDATFAPYTNICPISGHTEASVQRDGKNLAYQMVNNAPMTNSLNAGSYTVSVGFNETTTLSSSGINIREIYTDGSSSNIGFINVENISTSERKDVTVSISDGSKIGLNTYGSVFSKMQDIQVELGSTATPYVPYAGKTYTIALGDTIYGGTVDFDSGVMTASYVSKTFDENVVLTVGTSQSSGLRYADIVYSQNDMGAKRVSDNYMICSSYAKIDSSDTPTYGTFRVYSDSVAFLDEDFVDVASAKTKLNGVQLVYELATPFTIQLTPAQIQLLKGTNTISASTGQISVTANGVSGAIGHVQEQVNELADGVTKLHYHKVAESAATGTRADKLASLYTTYTTLQNDVRKTAILVRNNADIFHAVNNGGAFSSVYLDISTTVITGISLNPGSFVANINGTTTDGSSTENAEVYSLWIIE